MLFHILQTLHSLTVMKKHILSFSRKKDTKCHFCFLVPSSCPQSLCPKLLQLQLCFLALAVSVIPKELLREGNGERWWSWWRGVMVWKANFLRRTWLWKVAYYTPPPLPPHCSCEHPGVTFTSQLNNLEWNTKLDDYVLCVCSCVSKISHKLDGLW